MMHLETYHIRLVNNVHRLVFLYVRVVKFHRGCIHVFSVHSPYGLIPDDHGARNGFHEIATLGNGRAVRFERNPAVIENIVDNDGENLELFFLFRRVRVIRFERVE